MKRVKYDTIHEFQGVINGKTIESQSLYYELTSAINELCDTLADIEIAKDDEFINDLIDCTINLYEQSELTAEEIYDALHNSIDSFDFDNTNDLTQLKFYTDDSRLTRKYFDYINDRLKTGYYTN